MIGRILKLLLVGIMTFGVLITFYKVGYDHGQAVTSEKVKMIINELIRRCNSNPNFQLYTYKK